MRDSPPPQTHFHDGCATAGNGNHLPQNTAQQESNLFLPEKQVLYTSHLLVPEDKVKFATAIGNTNTVACDPGNVLHEGMQGLWTIFDISFQEYLELSIDLSNKVVYEACARQERAFYLGKTIPDGEKQNDAAERKIEYESALGSSFLRLRGAFADVVVATQKGLEAFHRTTNSASDETRRAQLDAMEDASRSRDSALSELAAMRTTLEKTVEALKEKTRECDAARDESEKSRRIRDAETRTRDANDARIDRERSQCARAEQLSHRKIRSLETTIAKLQTRAMNQHVELQAGRMSEGHVEASLDESRNRIKELERAERGASMKLSSLEEDLRFRVRKAEDASLEATKAKVILEGEKGKLADDLKRARYLRESDRKEIPNTLAKFNVEMDITKGKLHDAEEKLEEAREKADALAEERDVSLKGIEHVREKMDETKREYEQDIGIYQEAIAMLKSKLDVANVDCEEEQYPLSNCKQDSAELNVTTDEEKKNRALNLSNARKVVFECVSEKKHSESANLRETPYEGKDELLASFERKYFKIKEDSPRRRHKQERKDPEERTDEEQYKTPKNLTSNELKVTYEFISEKKDLESTKLRDIPYDGKDELFASFEKTYFGIKEDSPNRRQEKEKKNLERTNEDKYKTPKKLTANELKVARQDESEQNSDIKELREACGGTNDLLASFERKRFEIKKDLLRQEKERQDLERMFQVRYSSLRTKGDSMGGGSKESSGILIPVEDPEERERINGNGWGLPPVVRKAIEIDANERGIVERRKSPTQNVERAFADNNKTKRPFNLESTLGNFSKIREELQNVKFGLRELKSEE